MTQAPSKITAVEPADKDEPDRSAEPGRAQQLALIDDIVRDYEPVLRELGRR